jgi:DNA polymerase-3 subunit epsilon
MDTRLAHDREESRRWARKLLERSDWAILDTETTGLDGAAEIVQVAVLAPDNTTLIDTLVRPHSRIPFDAVAIHGITDAMVAEAPHYPIVHPRLLDVLQGRLIVAYNAQFDQRMLRQTALSHRLANLPSQWDCAMEQYSRFVGQWSSRRGSYAWVPLPRPDAPPGYKHQAIDDCRATLAVIRRMARD